MTNRLERNWDQGRKEKADGLDIKRKTNSLKRAHVCCLWPLFYLV